MRGLGQIAYRRRRRAWRSPSELITFALYFVCGVLLILSRIGHGAISEARDGVADLTAPFLEIASVPVVQARHTFERLQAYVGLFHELDRLKRENDTLKAWEWRGKLLERKVEHLHALLNAVDEPGLNFTTGRVIADARGPFLRSALINLGRDQGVRVGYAVISGTGLVGRTIDTSASSSRVLLLNDLNSRIPVLVGRAGIRAIVVGDNSAKLRIEFVPDGASLYPGDEVYTSGNDGVLPRGLRVGKVVGSSGAFKVRPHARLHDLDSVSVLFFDAPALAITDPAVPLARVLSANPKSARKTDVPPPPTSTADLKQVGGPAALPIAAPREQTP